MYKYRAILLKVVDGDTIDARIDLGFNIFIHERIRLWKINAPETRTLDLKEKKQGKSKEKAGTIAKGITCSGLTSGLSIYIP